MAIGDLIILRKGSSNVCAVGEVASDYLWLDDFGDIDGWDLQHVRRVRWIWKYKDIPTNLGANVLRFGDSVQDACSAELQQWIEKLDIGKKCVFGKPALSRILGLFPGGFAATTSG
jgi:hypothetical protein